MDGANLRPNKIHLKYLFITVSEAFPSGFPKIGISSFFRISRKKLGFQPPAGTWNPYKSTLKSLKMREIPIFAKSQFEKQPHGKGPQINWF